nr:15870_t:CDS:2 [Entrophospora candida]
MEYMEGFSYGIAIEVNIAICYSCDHFKEYMELKQKPEAERDIFTRLAIHRPDGLCASQLAEHYKLLWAVREEMRQVNNV